MNQAITVVLHDTEVGILRHAAQGKRESASFEYLPQWQTSAQAFPLEPQLPVVRGPQFHKKLGDGSVFHAIIADTEPDGWGKRVILRDYAKRRRADASKAPLHSLDFLLAVEDLCRIGGLRFKDANGHYLRTSQDGARTPQLLELSHLLAASQAVESQSESQRDLTYLQGRATSVGGLRPKCNVIDDNGKLSIAKFPSITDERPVPKGEVLALTLAQHAGINAAPARIVSVSGLPVALIQRFDRRGDHRILYASAATMLGVQATEERSYTEIATVLRQVGHQPLADICELWRRIAFSILITNVDDHLLNHGFLHVANGQWRLSPAFDINPFPDRLRELKTWISEDAGPEARIEFLWASISQYGIRKALAKEILGDVVRAVARWKTVAQQLGFTSREVDSFANAFEHEERRSAAKLL